MVNTSNARSTIEVNHLMLTGQQSLDGATYGRDGLANCWC